MPFMKKKDVAKELGIDVSILEKHIIAVKEDPKSGISQKVLEKVKAHMRNQLSQEFDTPEIYEIPVEIETPEITKIPIEMGIPQVFTLQEAADELDVSKEEIEDWLIRNLHSPTQAITQETLAEMKEDIILEQSQQAEEEHLEIPQLQAETSTKITPYKMGNHLPQNSEAEREEMLLSKYEAADKLDIKTSELVALMEEEGDDPEQGITESHLVKYEVALTVAKNANFLVETQQNQEQINQQITSVLGQLQAQEGLNLANQHGAIKALAYKAQQVINDKTFFATEIQEAINRIQSINSGLNLEQILQEAGLELPENTLGKVKEAGKGLTEIQKMVRRQSKAYNYQNLTKSPSNS